MRIKEGSQVIIQNALRPQGTPDNPPIFVIHELSEYKGQYIVFASKMPHQQHVFLHGFETIPERAACFVLLPNETDGRRVEFTNELRGHPLFLQQGPDRLLIINWRSTLADIANGATNDKAELLERGRKVIDLYDEWRHAGYVMPLAFKVLRDRQNGDGT